MFLQARVRCNRWGKSWLGEFSGVSREPEDSNRDRGGKQRSQREIREQWNSNSDSHPGPLASASDETFDDHLAHVMGVASRGDTAGDHGKFFHEIGQVVIEVIFDQREA